MCLSSDCQYDWFLKVQTVCCLLTASLTCSCRYSLLPAFWLTLWLVFEGTVCLPVFCLSLWLVLEGTVCLSAFCLLLWLVLEVTVQYVVVFWLSLWPLWLVLECTVCLFVFWFSLRLVLGAPVHMSVCLLTVIMTYSWRYSLSFCLLTAIMTCSWSYGSVCLSSSDCHYGLYSLFLNVQSVSLSSDFLYDLLLELQYSTSVFHLTATKTGFEGTVCLSVFWLSLGLALEATVQYVCLSSDRHYDLFSKVVESSMCVCLLTVNMTGSWSNIMFVCLLTFMRNGSWRFIASVCHLTYSILRLGSHKYRMSVFWQPLWLVFEGTVCLSAFWLPLWLALDATVQYVSLSSDCHYGLFLKSSLSVCLLTDIMTCSWRYRMYVCLLTDIMICSWMYGMSVFLLISITTCSWS